MNNNTFPRKGEPASLDGKIAIVTGAAKGIGFGCARVLGSAGATIAAIDVDEPALQSVVQHLRENGVTAEAYCADVSSTEAVDSAIQAIAARFERIDVVVNNAGVHDSKGIEAASEGDWDRIISTNLKSIYLVTKAALPYLKATHGSIVNMGSMVGLVGQGSAGAYSATKGAIVALTKNMALDFAPGGIRVNCVCPGWVETPLVNLWFAAQPDEPAARSYINSVHPLGRIASADEIGQVVLFLASAQSSFVTGVALPVDGGVTLGY
jgi:NAD(P)-dependent dehydrogenase (short-subunit alcohol dehydrogenase family)